MMKSLSGLAAAAALSALLAAPASAMISNTGQGVPGDELLRFVYSRPFPIQCSDAGQAGRDLRANPSSDPAVLHAVMSVYLSCANSPAGRHSAELYNNAMYGFAAAALLAARHESATAQSDDLRSAQTASRAIVEFYRSPRSFQGPQPVDPSIFRTNAGRIDADATALLTAIEAPAPNS